MSSGKQLSFSFGEVSPSLRFKVDGDFYSQGLSKLKNAIVRKSGGVSNRPGTNLIAQSFFQDQIPSRNSNAKLRVFPFTASNNRRFLVVVLDRIPGAPPSWNFQVDGTFRPQVITFIDVKTGEEFIPANTGIGNNSYEDRLIPLNKIKYTYLGDTLLFSFPSSSSSSVPGYRINYQEINDQPIFSTGDHFAFSVPASIGGPAVLGDPYGFSWGGGSAPVSYQITQEKWNGEESPWAFVESAFHHPSATSHFGFRVNFPEVGNQVKQYNIYRTSAVVTADANNVITSITANGYYTLVGRVPAGSPSAFGDFASVSDITQSWPNDFRLYTAYTQVAYYKERAIVIPVASLGNFLPGTIICSKLGSPTMFTRPVSPNITDAFSFTIPVDKLNRITNMIAANRLVVFTEQNTIIIRGGEGGVLSPLDVNPQTISHEGSSDVVNPVQMGDNVFFVNFDRSKLMMLAFARDDQFQVIDISVIGEHLFEPRDIIEMATSAGTTDTLWLLKRDGTLLSFSFSEQGVQGFARHEVGGKIESIAVQADKELFPQNSSVDAEIPTLFMSVIRDGVRYYEKFSYRNDREQDSFCFADAFKSFGLRLRLNVETGTYDQPRLNITTETNFNAGEVVRVTQIGGIDCFGSNVLDKKIDFYFSKINPDTCEEYVTTMRFHPTRIFDSSSLQGYFEEDLPEELQDLESQNPEEKEFRQTWWQFVFNYAEGLDHLKNKKVSVYADGQVLSSPLNPNIETLTVDGNGRLDLPGYYHYGIVGLPYETEIETLDLETGDRRTFTDVGKLINSVGIGFYNTRGGFVGQTGCKELNDLEEFRLRESEMVDQGTELFSGHTQVPFPGTWEKTGRVLIKQVDPLPMTVLAVYPKGIIGGS